jgi:hypothetical protein
MSEVWIKTARKYVCVVCNHDDVLRKVNRKGACAIQLNLKNKQVLQTMREPQNGADLVQYVAAVKLDEIRGTQLLEACGPSPSSTSESVRR